MEITRAQLYRLVCEKPLSKVGPELAISGTVLAKLCKQHDVPYPGSGHWTRVAMGMASTLDTLGGDHEQAAQIPATPPKRIKINASIAPQKQQDSVRTRSIVKQRLVQPHPIVVALLDQHETERREILSGRHPYRTTPPPSWTELDRRRYRITDAVLKELERRGGTVADVGKSVQSVTIDGEKIEFQVREKMRQSKVPVPDRDR